MFHVKQYKIPAIVCSILCCLAILLSFTPISSFAYEGSESGYYTIDVSSMDTSSFSSNSSFDISGTFHSIRPAFTPAPASFDFLAFNDYDSNCITFADTSTIPVSTTTFVAGEDVILEIYFDVSDSIPTLDAWLSSNSVYVPTSDPPVDPPSSYPILEGFYKLLPRSTTNFDPSYIGDGNSISFSPNDAVAVFQYGDVLFIDVLTLSLRTDGIYTYLDISIVSSNAGSDPILIATYTLTTYTDTATLSLPIDPTFNPTLGTFLNFEFADDSFEVDEDTYNLFTSIFDYSTTQPPISERPITPEPPPTDWVENPFVVILSMIIEALQVPLFGYFSPWDILLTILGVFITMWLLKLIAGG